MHYFPLIYCYLEIFTFPSVFFSMITLPNDFVMYGQIQFIRTILSIILNRAITENNINISYKESFFQYSAWGDENKTVGCAWSNVL